MRSDAPGSDAGRDDAAAGDGDGDDHGAGERRLPPVPPWVWVLGLAVLAVAASAVAAGVAPPFRACPDPAVAGEGAACRRAEARRYSGALALAGILLLALLWAACGGGGTTFRASSPGTPAGSYSLNVTGSYSASGPSANLSHTTTLTLKVN